MGWRNNKQGLHVETMREEEAKKTREMSPLEEERLRLIHDEKQRREDHSSNALNDLDMGEPSMVKNTTIHTGRKDAVTTNKETFWVRS